MNYEKLMGLYRSAVINTYRNILAAEEGLSLDQQTQLLSDLRKTLQNPVLPDPYIWPQDSSVTEAHRQYLSFLKSLKIVKPYSELVSTYIDQLEITQDKLAKQVGRDQTLISRIRSGGIVGSVQIFQLLREKFHLEDAQAEQFKLSFLLAKYVEIQEGVMNKIAALEELVSD